MASATSHGSLRHAQVMMAIGEAVGIQHYTLRVTRDPSLVALLSLSVSSLDSFIFFARTYGRLRPCVVAIRVCLVFLSDCSSCLGWLLFVFLLFILQTESIHPYHIPLILLRGGLANTSYASLAIDSRTFTASPQYRQHGLFIRLVV